MPAIIDMHAHYVAPDLIAEAERDGASYGVRIIRDCAGRSQLRFDDGTVLRPFFAELCGLAIRLPGLDAAGVAEQIVSTWTDMAGDNLPPAQGARWARLQNETLAADAARHAPHFSAMGTLPMQDVGLALSELDYIAGTLGLRAVEIGTNINGRDLDQPDFRPLWRRLNDLDMVVLLHPPLRPVGDLRTGDFFLNNLLGYPVDTTVAAARLLFSGVFQELPELKICLAHGGGFLPYQIGRLDRGFAAHPACSKSLTVAPSDLLRAFHYDSLTHNDQALAFLLGMVGADRVVYGSDYPFEMLDASGPARIQHLPLDEAPRHAILGGTMRALLQVGG
jgi:aminocarboxymuconate-semialdehyde decarboxylase